MMTDGVMKCWTLDFYSRLLLVTQAMWLDLYCNQSRSPSTYILVHWLEAYRTATQFATDCVYEIIIKFNLLLRGIGGKVPVCISSFASTIESQH